MFHKQTNQNMLNWSMYLLCLKNWFWESLNGMWSCSGYYFNKIQAGLFDYTFPNYCLSAIKVRLIGAEMASGRI